MTFKDELHSAFNQTYQAIGADLGCSEGIITREDLFDICLDHVNNYGDMSDEVAEFWSNLTFAQKLEYLPHVFECELYEA
jgi:hypothetical protein